MHRLSLYFVEFESDGTMKDKSYERQRVELIRETGSEDLRTILTGVASRRRQHDGLSSVVFYHSLERPKRLRHSSVLRMRPSKS
jgi:hypothetical protein